MFRRSASVLAESRQIPLIKRSYALRQRRGRIVRRQYAGRIADQIGRSAYSVTRTSRNRAHTPTRLDAVAHFHDSRNMKTSTVIQALGALAHESRLGVFRFLMQCGPDGAPAGEIAVRMKLPAATLSFHLSSLRHAGLVVSRRESRSIIYTANFEIMNAVLIYLTENCCQGHPEFCAVPHCEPRLASSKQATGPRAARNRTSEA